MADNDKLFKMRLSLKWDYPEQFYKIAISLIF